MERAPAQSDWMESVKSLLVSSLSAPAEIIENATKQTRESLASSDFRNLSNDANYGFMKMAAVIPAYIECMEKLGVRTRMELEKLWDAHYTEPGVEDAVQSLLQAENCFTVFVAEVESSKLSPFEAYYQ